MVHRPESNRKNNSDGDDLASGKLIFRPRRGQLGEKTAACVGCRRGDEALDGIHTERPKYVEETRCWRYMKRFEAQVEARSSGHDAS
jgi:hypothetical protein